MLNLFVQLRTPRATPIFKNSISVTIYRKIYFVVHFSLLKFGGKILFEKVVWMEKVLYTAYLSTFQFFKAKYAL